MRLKLFPPLSLAVLLVFSTSLSYSHTAPAARSFEPIPITVGVGLADYNPDWDHGHLLGGALWIDYTPEWLPGPLRGLGIEAEARDLSLNYAVKTGPLYREDVASGGVLYTWRHYRRFRPYGKFLMGYGNADWHGRQPGSRQQQSRTVTTAGGGIEMDAFHRVWVRADYEYQWWPDFFFVDTPAQGSLSPQGFTLGVSYHFGQPSYR
jgi:opacity protein-like surface antigen